VDLPLADDVDLQPVAVARQLCVGHGTGLAGAQLALDEGGVGPCHLLSRSDDGQLRGLVEVAREGTRRTRANRRPVK
jgi:hypothetical protein